MYIKKNSKTPNYIKIARNKYSKWLKILKIQNKIEILNDFILQRFKPNQFYVIIRYLGYSIQTYMLLFLFMDF